MDFDCNGILDLVSGSYDPGEVYLFRGRGSGMYQARETILDKSGKPVLRVHNQRNKIESFASSPALVDWDGDGDLDLLIGGSDGSIVIRINEGTRAEPAFAVESIPVLLENGEPLKVPGGYASPVAADWDGDGRWDLLSGSANGGAYWFRNVGKPGAPRFAPAELLIPAHVGIGYGEFLDADEEPRPGIRSQIAVMDYDRDGRLDILLGDFCTNVVARNDLTSSERGKLAAVREKLEDATAKAQNAYELIRLRLKEEFGHLTRDDAAREENQERWRNRVLELREVPAVKEVLQSQADCTDALRPYLEKPLHPAHGDDLAAAHGYVWLFLRK